MSDARYIWFIPYPRILLYIHSKTHAGGGHARIFKYSNAQVRLAATLPQFKHNSAINYVIQIFHDTCGTGLVPTRRAVWILRNTDSYGSYNKLRVFRTSRCSEIFVIEIECLWHWFLTGVPRAFCKCCDIMWNYESRILFFIIIITTGGIL